MMKFAPETGWDSGYLGRWLFSQGKVWITADGRQLQIKNMDYNHALNTLLYVERCGAEIAEKTKPGMRLVESYAWLHDTPLHKALRKRVERG